MPTIRPAIPIALPSAYPIQTGAPAMPVREIVRRILTGHTGSIAATAAERISAICAQFRTFATSGGGESAERPIGIVIRARRHAMDVQTKLAEAETNT